MRIRIDRIAFALAAVAALALAALMLALGDPARPGWWPPAAGFFLWAAGPFALPAWAARRRQGWFAATMLTALVAVIAVDAVAYRAMLRSQSSTAALALLFVPLWEWLALAALLAACLIVRRVTR